MTEPRFSPRPTRDDQRDDHHDHLDDQVMSRDAPIFVAGPWSHRSVSANGTRFHVAESGDGPLVLLLHRFPEFWRTWRVQLLFARRTGDPAPSSLPLRARVRVNPPRRYPHIAPPPCAH